MTKLPERGMEALALAEMLAVRIDNQVSVVRAAFEAGDDYAREYALLHLEELVGRQRAMFSIAQGTKDDGAFAAEADHVNLAPFIQSRSSHRPVGLKLRKS